MGEDAKISYSKYLYISSWNIITDLYSYFLMLCQMFVLTYVYAHATHVSTNLQFEAVDAARILVGLNN